MLEFFRNHRKLRQAADDVASELDDSKSNRFGSPILTYILIQVAIFIAKKVIDRILESDAEDIKSFCADVKASLDDIDAADYARRIR